MVLVKRITNDWEAQILKKAKKKQGLTLPEDGHSNSNRTDRKAAQSQREESPWQAARNYENRAKQEISDQLLQLFLEIRRVWLQLPGEFKKASDPGKLFKLNGKIFISPKTGKPLTEKQWETVVNSLDKAFATIFKDHPDRLVKKAMMLGKILQGMDYDSRVSVPEQKINWLKDLPKDKPEWKNSWLFAKQQSGELITNLEATSRKRITSTILDSIKNQNTPKQLELKLFEDFGDINRDWRRIAETQINDSLTNGLLLSEMEDSQEGETVYMIGISAGNACPYCKRLIEGQVVVLVDKPISGGFVKIKGKVFPAIWPGKSNIGRSAGDYWSVIPLHPHCRCSWTRYYPEMAKLLGVKKSIGIPAALTLQKAQDPEYPAIIINKSPTADTRTCDYSKVSKETLLQSSKEHINDVSQGLAYFQNRLKEAAEKHDYTKLSHINEFHKDFQNGFKTKNWYENIHLKNERHHIAHPKGSREDVDLIDVLEFISDGVMAGKARSGEYRKEDLPKGLLDRAFNNTIDKLLKIVRVK